MLKCVGRESDAGEGCRLGAPQQASWEIPPGLRQGKGDSETLETRSFLDPNVLFPLSILTGRQIDSARRCLTKADRVKAEEGGRFLLLRWMAREYSSGFHSLGANIE